jgi:short-subunit dehydrogenase
VTTQKTFWITGAASGLGAALATSALQSGHLVCATDIALDKLELTADKLGWPRERTLLWALDVRDSAAWQRAERAFKARFSVLDVMINNAGVLAVGPVHEASDLDIHAALDVNVKGVMFGGRQAASLMMAGVGSTGHIINICSLAGVSSVPGLGIYSASKFAVRGYSLALAFELKPLGIAVTCVCPDGIATPMLKPHEHSEHAALVFSGSRILSVEEVCSAIMGSVLERRMMELLLPEARGWIAKAASLAPELSSHVVRGLLWVGRRQQRKLAASSH